MEENTNPFLPRPAASTGSSAWSTQAQAGVRERGLFGTKTVDATGGVSKSGTATDANSVTVSCVQGGASVAAGASFGKANSAAPMTPKKQINRKFSRSDTL